MGTMRFSQAPTTPATGVVEPAKETAVSVVESAANALAVPTASVLDLIDFDSAPEPMFPTIGITPGNQGGGLRLENGTKEDESLPQGMVKCPVVIIGWRTVVTLWAKQKDDSKPANGEKDRPVWSAVIPSLDAPSHLIVHSFLNGGNGRCGYSYMRKPDRARFDHPQSLGHLNASIEIMAYYAKAQKTVVFTVPSHPRNWARTLQSLKGVDLASRGLVTLESDPHKEKGSQEWTSHAYKLTRGLVGGKPGEEARYMEGYAAFAAAANSDATLVEKVKAWMSGGDELLDDEKRQAILAATATLPIRTR